MIKRLQEKTDTDKYIWTKEKMLRQKAKLRLRNQEKHRATLFKHCLSTPHAPRSLQTLMLHVYMLHTHTLITREGLCCSPRLSPCPAAWNTDSSTPDVPTDGWATVQNWQSETTLWGLSFALSSSVHSQTHRDSSTCVSIGLMGAARVCCTICAA